ncbi:SMP-30/gluconolactonase/LRE family protein [Rhodoferax sp. TBRC 17660]|uniref:SMP-30/gluconolactonase/LRE family protein n=1 Tax=Rhodoferax potami TaxID=3068338 RepID=A0ABU3KLE3_9BURK|nr:SMP-30/gluconolactonase/LRE family protein [Rhodoferax sp. TBRC 17660]MDT7518084.1 SMP-30/gluconolactonase/LRE family protein [Rhodoferax sp. TBRC 17660]
MSVHTPAVEAVSISRDKVGESPVWSVANQCLYWVDIEGPFIHRLNWGNRHQSTWTLPERVGCIAMTERGTLIAAMETGIFEVTLSDPPVAHLSLLASVIHPHPSMRFNDGRCDHQGRFWAGTMVRDMGLASPAGGIYGLDESGLRGPVLEGYITPNGMGFSPDGTTAYLSDSHPSRQQIWKHSFDTATGTWGPQATWVDMQALPGRPDGAAVDAEGCYWICGNDAAQIHRFSPEGTLLHSVAVPVSKPAMCAFGGPELRHLFVTSIRPASPAPGFDATLDGALLVLELGVQGLPEPLFSRFPVR